MSKRDVLTWVQENVGNIEARDYQIEAWDKLQQRRAKGRKRALVHLATGLGKTSVAAVDVFHYLKEENPNGRVLFVSHMNDISEQAKNTFLFVNPNLTTTIFRGKLKDVSVTFSTFQALFRKLDTIDPTHFDYIIWDEAHHIEAETFSAVRKHFNPQFELGLTATPERADGRDIFNYFGHPIFTKSLADGINGGFLSAIDYHIVFDEAIKKAMNEKFELNTLKDIRELFAIRSRNEVISKEVLERRHEIGLDKAKTIVFCQNIIAATEMAKLLGGEVYHSDVPPEGREDIMKRFKNGALQVICTVDMFNEGIDVPDARLVVFLRSTSSRTIFEQQLGRGLRRAPGKDKVTVLDFVANVERINFVRELGRHVANRVHSNSGIGGGIAGTTPNERGLEVPFDRFSFNTFEFEYQVVEIMERYDTISGIEYLKTDEVLAKYKELNDNIVATAKHFGVSWNAIKKHLIKVGIDTSGHLAKGRALDDDEVIAKYNELGSVTKTANYYNVGTWIIKTKLEKKGVEIGIPNEKIYASPELIKAFEELGSVRKAAAATGLSRHMAMNRLRNSGVDMSRQPSVDDNFISHEKLAEIYEKYNGNIHEMVWHFKPENETSRSNQYRVGWTHVYRALDKYGYLDKRPITSAIASAAYYKYGTSTEAGKQLGVSGALISRRSKGAAYIKKYNNKQLAKKGV